MSKYIELLHRIVEGDNRGDFFISNEFLKEIEASLAQPEQDNIQYLLDQVARLTAENTMLKEKWASPKREPLSTKSADPYYIFEEFV